MLIFALLKQVVAMMNISYEEDIEGLKDNIMYDSDYPVQNWNNPSPVRLKSPPQKKIEKTLRKPANNLHIKIKKNRQKNRQKIVGGIAGGLLIAAAAKYAAGKAPTTSTKTKTKSVKKENRPVLNQKRKDNRGTNNDTINKVSDEIEKMKQIPANITSSDLVDKYSVEEKVPKENDAHDNAGAEKKQTNANVPNEDKKDKISVNVTSASGDAVDEIFERTEVSKENSAKDKTKPTEEKKIQDQSRLNNPNGAWIYSVAVAAVAPLLITF